MDQASGGRQRIRDELLHDLRRHRGSAPQEDDITLVGHNPALHQLHEWLSGQRIENFPTCAYSQMSVEVSQWTQLCAGCATLNAFVTPRMLKH